MGRGPWCAVHGSRLDPSDKDRQLLLKAQPRERKDLLVNQTNFAALTKAGQATRFGPSWPGLRCLPKTRENPAIKGWGRSTGLRTTEGKARSIAAHIQIKLARKIPLALFRTD